MATKAQQQQDEMVNTFVASIPTMQTDIALLKQDMSVVKTTNVTILDNIKNLSVVTKSEFEKYKAEAQKERDAFELRLKALENENENNKPGVKFANALVSRWTTFLVLLLLTAAVIALVGRFIPVGSVGV